MSDDSFDQFLENVKQQMRGGKAPKENKSFAEFLDNVKRQLKQTGGRGRLEYDSDHDSFQEFIHKHNATQQ